MKALNADGCLTLKWNLFSSLGLGAAPPSSACLHFPAFPDIHLAARVTSQLLCSQHCVCAEDGLFPQCPKVPARAFCLTSPYASLCHFHICLGSLSEDVIISSCTLCLFTCSSLFIKCEFQAGLDRVKFTVMFSAPRLGPACGMSAD